MRRSDSKTKASQVTNGDPKKAALQARDMTTRLIRRPSRDDNVVGGSGASSYSLGDPEERDDGRCHLDHDGVGALETPPVPAPGHNVIDRSAIEDALHASNAIDGFDHLSGGEEQRARLLIHYRGLQMFRPHVVGSTAMLERLRRLDTEAPNFAAVTVLVRRAAHLSAVSGRPLRVPPILMLGEPGVGKTRYARALATAMDSSLDVFNGASLPDTGSLTGYPPVWRGAGIGRIAKALIAAKTSGPLLFFDECEKIADHEAGIFPLDRLLTLLEPHSAAVYEDEYLQVKMRAHRICWIFAANTLDRLSEPFRDRVVTITIPGLSPEQRDDVLEAMLAEVAREQGLSMTLASREALVPLHRLGLRRACLVFELAIARAIESERHFLTMEDVRESVTRLGGADTRRRPIGFL